MAHELRILELINRGQLELGSTGKYLRVPEVPEEVVRALGGVRIAIIDDTKGVLSHWQPVLLTATGGNVATICHHTQTPDGLLQEIVNNSPDIILLDYELAGGLTGDRLVTPLREALPNAVIIGFSSSSTNNRVLEQAGVTISADKGARDETAVLQAIVSAYQRSTLSELGVGTPPMDLVGPAAPEVQHTESALKRALLAGVTPEFVMEAMSRLSCTVILKNTAPEFHNQPYSHEIAAIYGAVRLMKAFERITRGATSDLEKFLLVVSDLTLYDEELRTTMGWFGQYYEQQFALQERLVEDPVASAAGASVESTSFPDEQATESFA